MNKLNGQKIRIPTIILVLLAALGFTAANCGIQPAPKKLTRNDSGHTLVILKGHTFVLVLPDHSGGGYHFNKAQYDSTVIHLKSYSSQSPGQNGRVGATGEGSWVFTALRNGKTTLKVTLSRPWKPLDSSMAFRNIVLVK